MRRLVFVSCNLGISVVIVESEEGFKYVIEGFLFLNEGGFLWIRDGFLEGVLLKVRVEEWCVCTCIRVCMCVLVCVLGVGEMGDNIVLVSVDEVEWVVVDEVKVDVLICIF